MSNNDDASAVPPPQQPAGAARSGPALTAEEEARESEWRSDPELAFEDGVLIAFSRWEALRIGVNNMAGEGQTKVDELITTAVDWFIEESQ
jgi:hypothetical protein